jgi:preprotein translocase subunit SecD
MKIEVANTNEAKAVIEHILSEKFTFDLRIEKQAPTADTADTKANWEPTPITGEYLVWAQAIGNRQSGEVSVDLEFNDAGGQLIGDVFTKNKGKYIGIFVRDLLVSKLRISDPKTTNHLLIGGIPSAKIAEIFADDVNAGLFVTYTPTAPGTPVPSTPSSSAPATR